VNGKTIRIFLADGEPAGILLAEISDWTGKVLVAPRSQLGQSGCNGLMAGGRRPSAGDGRGRSRYQPTLMTPDVDIAVQSQHG
jgi:hypothetical protein